MGWGVLNAAGDEVGSIHPIPGGGSRGEDGPSFPQFSKRKRATLSGGQIGRKGETNHSLKKRHLSKIEFRVSIIDLTCICTFFPPLEGGGGGCDSLLRYLLHCLVLSSEDDDSWNIPSSSGLGVPRLRRLLSLALNRATEGGLEWASALGRLASTASGEDGGDSEWTANARYKRILFPKKSNIYALGERVFLLPNFSISILMNIPSFSIRALAERAERSRGTAAAAVAGGEGSDAGSVHSLQVRGDQIDIGRTFERQCQMAQRDFFLRRRLALSISTVGFILWLI